MGTNMSGFINLTRLYSNQFGCCHMKIPITADLHYQERWFRWLVEQGASYDLVCIAGDLLDMLKSEPRMEQVRE
jgi:Icc-related predicted phosphoesterase